MGTKRGIDDPTMSDNTILMSVEDLISIALGPSDKNTVNFKLLQAILHILARQMRILGTNVELRVQEIKDRSEDPSSPRQKDKQGKDKSKKSVDKHGKTGEKGNEKSGKEGTKSAKESTDDGKEKNKKKHATKFDEDNYKGREKTSATSIALTEKQRDMEKVLIVEKGPPSLRTGSKTKVGSIEVVTQSQLDEMKAAINELKSIAGPIPTPELPDNEKLRSDLAKGNASLSDTMQAMQVTARLKAAEESIGRMAGLLTALSAAGALPQELLYKFGGGFEEIVTKADTPADGPRKSTPQKSVAVGIDVDTDARSSSPTRSEPSRKSLASKSTAKSTTSKVLEAGSLARQSVVSKQSVMTARASALVTRDEMNDALEQMKDDITKNITNLTTKPISTAEMALNTTRVISERMEVALKLNARISTLNSMVSDYAEQLSGFDTGLTSQMTSFQEQIAQIRADLKDGLKQLDQVNNNAETTAISELNERYDELMSELDRTAFGHQGLVTFQKQLGDDLHDVLECVETLREQKADRDEVLDGLRDKADNARLAGLLTEEEFTMARNEIDKRLEVCYDKFKRQEAVWMSALNDLMNVAETKAELMQLLGMKDDTQQELRELHEILKKLTVILGEPKAAILTRKLAKDATCGSCLAPALMDPLDANYGAPPPLPAMGPKPIGATDMEIEPCLEYFKPPHPPDNREHTCHRWVGGSHTLISESVTREQAVPLNIQLTPTKKYTGYGFDGRLYRLEEELQPCIECNLLKAEADAAVPVPPLAVLPEDGAGDKG